jgi:putative endonuclease
MAAKEQVAAWFVYILECENGLLYTGIAKDVEKRFTAHVQGKGAIFTRLNPPLAILASQTLPSHSAAAKMEAQIKKWKKPEKLLWIKSNPHLRPAES